LRRGFRYNLVGILIIYERRVEGEIGIIWWGSLERDRVLYDSHQIQEGKLKGI
jgi:hypothetical protein